MKRLLFFITLLALVSLACGGFIRPTPTVAAPPDLTATPLGVQNEATPMPRLPLFDPSPTVAILPSLTATPLKIPTETQVVPDIILPGFDPAKLGTSDMDVTYCTVDGVDLKMDVYYPAAANGLWPAVMYVHGGGWTIGNKTIGAGTLGFLELQQAGFLVVSVDYRLAPEYKFPAMIEDVKCAVRFLRANAKHFNIDSNRIGAYGGSAGGHLVALLGVADDSAGWDVGQYVGYSSRVRAVVDMFGPTDLPSLLTRANTRTALEVFSSGQLEAASPIAYVTPDDAPFLILQGDKDTTVPPQQSQTFYDRLVSANVPATLVMVKNAEHGFLPVGGAIDPSREQLTQMIVDFFTKYLK